MSKLERFNPEIANKIRKGDYFKEAWDWYALKYIYPVAQRTFFIVISIVAIIITSLSIMTLGDFFPLNKEFPVVVENKDMSLDYTELTSIPVGEDNDITRPVVEYLIKHYVRHIESYRYNDFDRKLTFLTQFSSAALQREITKRYDIRNLDSLVLKYRDHTIRDITIEQVQLRRADGFDHSDTNLAKPVSFEAEVFFEANEQTPVGTKTRDWIALIDLSITPILQNPETKEFPPLDFTVQHYTVKPRS